MRLLLPLLAILGIAAAFPAVTPNQVRRTASSYELEDGDLDEIAANKAIVDMRANPTVCVGGVSMIDGGVMTGNLCNGAPNLDDRPERAGVSKYDSARFR